MWVSDICGWEKTPLGCYSATLDESPIAGKAQRKINSQIASRPDGRHRSHHQTERTYDPLQHLRCCFQNSLRVYLQYKNCLRLRPARPDKRHRMAVRIVSRAKATRGFHTKLHPDACVGTSLAQDDKTLMFYFAAPSGMRAEAVRYPGQ